MGAPTAQMGPPVVTLSDFPPALPPLDLAAWHETRAALHIAAACALRGGVAGPPSACAPVAAAHVGPEVGKGKRGKKRRLASDDAKRGIMPSGFLKPVLLSPELAKALGHHNLEQTVPRQAVVAAVMNLVKEKQLYQSENNRKIWDLTREGGEDLREVFPEVPGEDLTFFTFQRRLKLHLKDPVGPVVRSIDNDNSAITDGQEA
tara:strand:- start:6095 stop:6706 length:612 start_codon:yes stop_codon:yes gene_type:complete